MPDPGRLAVAAVNASTRAYLVRKAKFKDHPITKAPLCIEPAMFITFPGGHSPIYFDDRNVKVYGFKGLHDFILWFKIQPFLSTPEGPEVVFSACLGRALEPVGQMNDREVAEELGDRLLLAKAVPVEETNRSALLDLRRLAGEAVKESERTEPEPVAALPDGNAAEEATLTDSILGSIHKTGR